MRSKFVVVLLALFFVASCYRGPYGALETGGGVSVGNGADGTEKTYSTYYSPKYSFGFKYADSLSLTQIKEEHLTIDNRQAVEGRAELLSRLDVSVVVPPNAVRNLEDLFSYARSVHQKGEAFTKTEKPVPGAVGIVAEARDGESLQKVFYFLTTNHLVIRLDLKSHRKGPGWQEVERVVESFTYDGTPPVVTSVRMDAVRRWPGSTLIVYIGAEDDFSGLVGGRVKMMWLGGKSPGSMLISTTEITAENYDPERQILQAKLKLPAWISFGIFQLINFDVTDRAGNTRSVWVKSPKQEGDTLSRVQGLFKGNYEHFELPTKADPAKTEKWLPLAFAPVPRFWNWDFGDSEIPNVTKITPSSSEVLIRRGESEGILSVALNATDDKSGIIGSKMRMTLVQTRGAHVGYEIELAEEILESHVTKKNAYLIPFKLPAHAPAGVYRTKRIVVRDLANTYPDVLWELVSDLFLQKKDFSREKEHAFDVVIDNENPADVDAPEIRQLSLENERVRVGESLFLNVEYADLSGLVGGKAHVHFYEPYKKGEEKRAFAIEMEVKAKYHVSETQVRLEIPISPFQRKGHYRMGSLRLWDKSGNEVLVYGHNEHEPFETLMTYHYDETEKKSSYAPYWHTVNVPEVEIVP